jgi:hypothetical protein
MGTDHYARSSGRHGDVVFDFIEARIVALMPGIDHLAGKTVSLGEEFLALFTLRREVPATRPSAPEGSRRGGLHL